MTGEFWDKIICSIIRDKYLSICTVLFYAILRYSTLFWAHAHISISSPSPSPNRYIYIFRIMSDSPYKSAVPFCSFGYWNTTPSSLRWGYFIYPKGEDQLNGMFHFTISLWPGVSPGHSPASQDHFISISLFEDHFTPYPLGVPYIMVHSGRCGA